MLVLAVKAQESIVVGRPDGSRVTVYLVSIRGDRAKLGIEVDAASDATTAIYRQTILNTMSPAEQDRVLRAGRAMP